MNLHGNRSGRNADDLRDRIAIEPFEVAHHDLPIQRLETMDQLQEPLECVLMANRLFGLGISCGQGAREFVEGHDGVSFESKSAAYMRGSNVMCHPIYPSAQRASAIELLQATPDRDVNLLNQVDASIRIRLIGPSQANDRLLVGVADLAIQVFLVSRF